MQEAEHLAATDDFRAGHERFQELNLQFKAAEHAGALNREFEVRFRRAMDQFYERRRADRQRRARLRDEARRVKEQLVIEATSVATWADATAADAEMKRLFERWRDAGPAGREYEDRLWASFSAARNSIRKRLPGPTPQPSSGPPASHGVAGHRARLERQAAGLQQTVDRIQWEIAELTGEIRNIEQALYYTGGGTSQSTLRRMNNQILKKQEILKRKWEKLGGIGLVLDRVRAELDSLD